MEAEIRRLLSVFELRERQCRFAGKDQQTAKLAELAAAAEQLHTAVQCAKGEKHKVFCTYWLPEFGCPELYATRVMAELSR